VFYKPGPSPLCGTHVHFSPCQTRKFKLSELQDIAYGTVYYEHLIVWYILPHEDRQHKYCRPNTERSSKLKHIVKKAASNEDALWNIRRAIYSERTKKGLRDLMQGTSRRSRYALWNFNNIVGPDGSGTIEFRGGTGSRDTVQTKRLISFVLAFVCLCFSKVGLRSRSPSAFGKVSDKKPLL
jgi:hypothetical protein